MVPLPTSEFRESALKELDAIAKAQDVDERVRALAAAVIVSTDPSRQSLLVDLLREGGAVQLKLLGILRHLRGLIDDPELVGFLASLFHDPRLGVSSIRAAGCAGIPGFVELFWDALPDSEGSSRAELLFWLASRAPGARSFEAWRAGMRELDPDGRGRCLFAMSTLTEQADKEIAVGACELAAEHYLKRLREHGRGLLATLQFGLVFKYGSGPHAKELADYIESHFEDPWFCSYARVYHARHDSDGGVARLAVALAVGPPNRTDSQEWHATVQVAQTVFAGTGNSSAAEAFAAAGAGAEAGALGPIIDLLLSIGGPTAIDRARTLVARLPAERQGVWLRRLRAPDPEAILAELKRGGMALAVELDSIAGRLEDSGGRDDLVLAVLEAADVLLLFDAESDEVPAPYPPLLELFASVSHGAFAPEAIHQIFTRAEDAGSDNKYIVQFIHGDRLYKFFPADIHDWYDVDTFVDACNTALNDAGREERFLCAENDGQCVTYGCLTRAQAQFLTDVFQIDWGRQLDTAW